VPHVLHIDNGDIAGIVLVKTWNGFFPSFRITVTA
jgi:hypothetical protein